LISNRRSLLILSAEICRSFFYRRLGFLDHASDHEDWTSVSSIAAYFR
jgi:hypothetical protein